MRIDISKVWTAASLRDHLKGAGDGLVIEFFKSPKNSESQCQCGCGKSTKSRFAPGHDSVFHSLAKQVARGLAKMPFAFVNDEAEADFMKWYDAEVPRHAARLEEKRVKDERLNTLVVPVVEVPVVEVPVVEVPVVEVPVVEVPVVEEIPKAPKDVKVPRSKAPKAPKVKAPKALDKDSKEYADLLALVTMGV